MSSPSPSPGPTPPDPPTHPHLGVGIPLGSTMMTTDAILAVAAPNAIPSTLTPPPRKFPAPCWTQEETLALITTYQDKWYSLRRRNLRTADWDAVADEVNLRCPNQSPNKSSAQCRHKMEKLRKRYRTEKQRLSLLPNNGVNGRFFGSNWVFFDLIHAMELGTGSGSGSVSGGVSVSVDVKDLDVKPFSMNHPNLVNNVNDKKGVDLGMYFDEIMMGMPSRSDVNKGKNQNHEFDVRSQNANVNMNMNMPAPHIKFRVKDHQRNAQHGHGHYAGDDIADDFDEGGDEGYSGGGFKRKMGGYDGVYSDRIMAGNGNGSGNGGSSRGGKDSVVGEMVASIRMLGEGMVKMEKMKMEMMRDIEKMRMEMEMKRSEMILESQHLIVNAFVEGLKKSKKVKVGEIE